MNILEELIAKIDTNREILNTLPRNNTKNINNYVKALDEYKKEFIDYEKDILKEMGKRVSKISEIKENPEIASIKDEVDHIDQYLYLLNNINTSYEKMNLDMALHNLRYYYKKNLEIVNETILYCIREFSEVGITITSEDFCYSKYVREYLDTFFMEMKNENIDLKKIQDKFDEIYWKCPNIIIHVELNIRYLYLKNEKTIYKYYSQKQSEILANTTTEDILNKYMELKKQLIEKINDDEAIIINNFMNGNLNIKDYLPAEIEKRYANFVSEDILEAADENKLNEIDLNMRQLLNSIYEYKNYLNFKFIIDDIRKIHNEKDKYKNAYEQTKKEIANKEKQVIKISTKVNGSGLFKKANDGLISKQDELILELKKLYKELNQNKVYCKIATELNDNSTISEAIYLASSFYSFVFNCIRENNKEVPDEEIEEIVIELKEFVKWPYSTIINNIGILEEKNILLIIRDRYQLLNINMQKEDLDIDNLDSLIEMIKDIEISHNIRKNNIDLETIGYIYEMKKILDK